MVGVDGGRDGGVGVRDWGWGRGTRWTIWLGVRVGEGRVEYLVGATGWGRLAPRRHRIAQGRRETLGEVQKSLPHPRAIHTLARMWRPLQMPADAAACLHDGVGQREIGVGHGKVWGGWAGQAQSE